MSPTLWLVSTPIGNLGDLQPRAVEVLTAAALVACEDTRRTAKLLNHAGVRAERLVVANDHTEFGVTDQILDVLAGGGDVAVVSDAGTPGISDPGQRIVDAVIAAGFAVSAVPGPTAAIMALTVSGLATDRFCFEGFLPRKGSDRTQRLNALAAELRTTVLYEAPHRIQRTLIDLAEACGPERAVVVCRELTKLHETIVRSTLGQVDVGEPRGEYVIVLAGHEHTDPEPSDAQITAELADQIQRGATKRDAVTAVSERLGLPKNRVYDLLHRRGSADEPGVLAPDEAPAVDTLET